MQQMAAFETKTLQEKYDYLAPDKSEIRLLPCLKGGGLAHCTLPPGRTSSAVSHKTVEEIWYFFEGEGQVWRKQGSQEQVTEVNPGVSITIPHGVHFQFKNTGTKSLKFIISTMPPWPGATEAYSVPGYWQ
jgi:mannose-6-phosphate isomerase-like protein (cupin superfamily)